MDNLVPDIIKWTNWYLNLSFMFLIGTSIHISVKYEDNIVISIFFKKIKLHGLSGCADGGWRRGAVGVELVAVWVSK